MSIVWKTMENIESRVVLIIISSARDRFLLKFFIPFSYDDKNIKTYKNSRSG